MSKRVSLENLIEANLINPPFPIWVKYKGQRFDAEIDQHGFVQMDGKPYTSLSLAGGTVRSQSIWEANGRAVLSPRKWLDILVLYRSRRQSP
jgi:hypothetical protein